MAVEFFRANACRFMGWNQTEPLSNMKMNRVQQQLSIEVMTGRKFKFKYFQILFLFVVVSSQYHVDAATEGNTEGVGITPDIHHCISVENNNGRQLSGCSDSQGIGRQLSGSNGRQLSVCRDEKGIVFRKNKFGRAITCNKIRNSKWQFKFCRKRTNIDFSTSSVDEFPQCPVPKSRATSAFSSSIASQCRKTCWNCPNSNDECEDDESFFWVSVRLGRNCAYFGVNSERRKKCNKIVFEGKRISDICCRSCKEPDTGAPKNTPTARPVFTGTPTKAEPITRAPTNTPSARPVLTGTPTKAPTTRAPSNAKPTTRAPTNAEPTVLTARPTRDCPANPPVKITPVTDWYQLVTAVRGWIDNVCNALLKYGEIREWVTSEVTNMKEIFRKQKTFNENIGPWDTSSVTDMQQLFQSCSSFNGDISSWDTSSVTEMKFLFNNAKAFNQDLSSWDLSNVQDMTSILEGATRFNTKMINMNILKLTSMVNIFKDTNKFKSDLNWQTSNVKYMEGIFSGALNFNGVISSWDTSLVTEFQAVFKGAVKFNSDISSWDISSITDMPNMFYKAQIFNRKIGDWDTSSVTKMNYLFSKAEEFNGDIRPWDVSNVTDMNGIFSQASSFNVNISEWQISKVQILSYFFGERGTNKAGFHPIGGFNQDVGSFDVSSAKYTDTMFGGLYGFNQDLSSWDTSSMGQMNGMFLDCQEFNSILNNWDMSKNSKYSRMFEHAFRFNTDISSWDTSNGIHFQRMFKGVCSFDLSYIASWDLGKLNPNKSAGFKDFQCSGCPGYPYWYTP